MPYIRVRPEGLQRMSEMLDRVEKDIVHRPQQQQLQLRLQQLKPQQQRQRQKSLRLQQR